MYFKKHTGCKLEYGKRIKVIKVMKRIILL